MGLSDVRWFSAIRVTFAVLMRVRSESFRSTATIGVVVNVFVDCPHEASTGAFTIALLPHERSLLQTGTTLRLTGGNYQREVQVVDILDEPWVAVQLLESECPGPASDASVRKRVPESDDNTSMKDRPDPHSTDLIAAVSSRSSIAGIRPAPQSP